MQRRHFLRTIASVAPVLALPRVASAVPALPVGPRVLTFAHLHTAERLEVEYMDGARYLPDALSAVNHLLRDFRTGDVHAIDPALLDVLHALRTSTGSLHMQGQAIDIRVGDVPLRALRDAALDLARGGVGYYPASNFVHVDTGRVRRW